MPSGVPAAQEADKDALRNMEESAQDVSARVAQLAADREKLAESRASTSADLEAAKESLAAKKAALSQAADTNRRNGCVLSRLSLGLPCNAELARVTAVAHGSANSGSSCTWLSTSTDAVSVVYQAKFSEDLTIPVKRLHNCPQCPAMLDEGSTSVTHNRAQRDFLAQKLEGVDAQLREAKADRRESVRRRPLRSLPPTSLPRTTRLSQTLPPTTQTRQTRTPRQRRRELLWAAKWMDVCRAQRIVVVFVLVCVCSASGLQLDQRVGPLLTPHVHYLATFATQPSLSKFVLYKPALTVALATCFTTALATADA